MFWRRKILIYADFIDPFCYIGFHNLSLAAGTKWTLEWRGFELNPATPPEGMNLETAGNSEVRIGQWAAVQNIGLQAGLPLKQPSFVPNTRCAHALIFGVQRNVKIPLIARIYQAYFIDQLDIGSISILADLASSFGVTTGQVDRFIRDERVTRDLKSHQKQAIRHVFPGMPGFVRGWNEIYFGALSRQDWEKRLAS